MDYLTFEWRVYCDGGKAHVHQPSFSFNVSSRPDSLTWFVGGYSHRVEPNTSQSVETIECQYDWCDEKNPGTRITLKANLKWILHEFTGPSGVGPVNWPALEIWSKDTILWESGDISVSCDCCPDSATPMPEVLPCISGGCEG